MSKFKVPTNQRFSIYDVHKRICIWCKEPLKWIDLEIDHILPEELLKYPGKLKSILLEYGLPEDYEINGLANLVPSCHRCNNSKRNQVYNLTPIIQMVLEESRKLYQDKQLKSVKFREEMKNSKNEAFLESALENGNISPKSIREVLIRFEDALANPSSVMSSFVTVSGLIPAIDHKWKYIEDSNNMAIVFNGFNSAYTISPEHFSIALICKYCLYPGPWIGNVCQTCGHENDNI